MSKQTKIKMIAYIVLKNTIARMLKNAKKVADIDEVPVYKVAEHDKLYYYRNLLAYADSRIAENPALELPATRKECKQFIKKLKIVARDFKAQVESHSDLNTKAYIDDANAYQRINLDLAELQQVVKLEHAVAEQESYKFNPPANTFLWDKMLLKKPTDGLVVASKPCRILASAAISAELELPDEYVAEQLEAGCIMVVLQRNLDNSPVCISVESSAILKAREQRYAVLASIAPDEQALADMIVEDLEGDADSRLRKPAKIIEKHTEDYLSCFTFTAIKKDVHRILSLQ